MKILLVIKINKKSDFEESNNFKNRRFISFDNLNNYEEYFYTDNDYLYEELKEFKELKFCKLDHILKDTVLVSQYQKFIIINDIDKIIPDANIKDENNDYYYLDEEYNIYYEFLLFYYYYVNSFIRILIYILSSIPIVRSFYFYIMASKTDFGLIENECTYAYKNNKNHKKDGIFFRFKYSDVPVRILDHHLSYLLIFIISTFIMNLTSQRVLLNIGNIGNIFYGMKYPFSTTFFYFLMFYNFNMKIKSKNAVFKFIIILFAPFIATISFFCYIIYSIYLFIIGNIGYDAYPIYIRKRMLLSQFTQ